jgi:hypothetical protein
MSPLQLNGGMCEATASGVQYMKGRMWKHKKLQFNVCPVTKNEAHTETIPTPRSVHCYLYFAFYFVRGVMLTTHPI